MNLRLLAPTLLLAASTGCYPFVWDFTDRGDAPLDSNNVGLDDTGGFVDDTGRVESSLDGVTILNPTSSSVFAPGGNALLRASVDGPAAWIDRVEWRSDLDGFLADELVSTEALYSEGEHNISVTVYDPWGGSVRDEVEVIVQEEPYDHPIDVVDWVELQLALDYSQLSANDNDNICGQDDCSCSLMASGATYTPTNETPTSVTFYGEFDTDYGDCSHLVGTGLIPDGPLYSTVTWQSSALTTVEDIVIHQNSTPGGLFDFGVQPDNPDFCMSCGSYETTAELNLLAGVYPPGIDVDIDLTMVFNGGTFAISRVPEVVGDLLITEMMGLPFAGLYPWFEVHNTTSDPLDLSDCHLLESSGVTYDFPGFTMQPGDYAVFSDGEAISGPPDGLHDGYDWYNNDYLAIRCEISPGFFRIIDDVDEVSSFPFSPGYSLELKPGVDADGNGDSTNWCEAVDAASNGDWGTPGDANTGCP